MKPLPSVRAYDANIRIVIGLCSPRGKRLMAAGES